VSVLVVQGLRRLILPVAALFGVMIGLGVLVTKVLNDTWPLTAEDSINRGLAADRSPAWTAVSSFFSSLGNTSTIVAVTAAVAIGLRLVLRRWREPLFLCAAVTAQAIVFYFVTVVIDRTRPAVTKMDVSPPTSSFPSGHTSAAVALYAGLALVLAHVVRHTWIKALVWALLLVPMAVALARMYRGMHHPSDVVASFLNGGVCIAVMARSVLDRAVRWGGSVAARPAARRQA
jgi:undecaprenyl-diphosphatase